MNTNYNMNKEVNEAIMACDNALYHLNEANNYLNSAGNWGILDIFGGGLISTFAKHSKMNNAQNEIQNAKNAVQILKRELQDVGRFEEINIETGDFISFADFFFDRFVADWLVQSRIRKAQEQINSAIYQIQNIKNQLYYYA